MLRNGRSLRSIYILTVYLLFIWWHYFVTTPHYFCIVLWFLCDEICIVLSAALGALSTIYVCVIYGPKVNIEDLCIYVLVSHSTSSVLQIVFAAYTFFLKCQFLKHSFRPRAMFTFLRPNVKMVSLFSFVIQVSYQ